ncbi:hypothetical protein [Beggiatoa leptomitoformis]|uniref:Uncharacterized protein n=1 Tax=Beggiatoa leptomitoformis TaxID=288004 RepID=A0A650GDT6_9GAMM|nr:hypothetical protein [Beggiatoa leptomitoformis]QGX03651.1 hypothetical protein AL038_18855 [Beggiatoa leptomitoformis]QGX04081.1 hypothetical protein BLE401_18605 [Beggiatoa leptomitoformis]
MLLLFRTTYKQISADNTNAQDLPDTVPNHPLLSLNLPPTTSEYSTSSNADGTDTTALNDVVRADFISGL